MKKIISILQILCLIGAYLVHYYTRSKMGMARYVVYINQKIEKNYPIDLIKYGAIFLILLLTIYIVVRLARLQNKAELIITLLSTAIFIAYSTFYNISMFRDYYFVWVILLLTCTLQLLKGFITKKKFPLS